MQTKFDQSSFGLAQVLINLRRKVEFYADAVSEYLYRMNVEPENSFWPSAYRSALEDYGDAIAELRQYERLSLLRYGRLVGIVKENRNE